MKADAEVTLCLSDSPASFLGGGTATGGRKGKKTTTANHVPLCAAVVCPLRACGAQHQPGGDRVLFIRVIENKCPCVALGWTGWKSYKQLPSCFPGREVEEGELGNADGEKGRPVLHRAERACRPDTGRYLHVTDLDLSLVGFFIFFFFAVEFLVPTYSCPRRAFPFGQLCVGTVWLVNPIFRSKA